MPSGLSASACRRVDSDRLGFEWSAPGRQAPTRGAGHEAGRAAGPIPAPVRPASGAAGTAPGPFGAAMLTDRALDAFVAGGNRAGGSRGEGDASWREMR